MARSSPQRLALNNALWCDAVCRAHGSAGALRGALWLHPGATPRFYPNAVTLEGAEAAPGQLAAIGELATAGLPAEWGVKDSFRALDLAPLGFRVLFEARWLWRPAVLPAPAASLPAVQWSTIETPGDLAAWEAAWSAEPANGGAAAPARVFLPPLLERADVAFLAARRAGRIVAGAVASRAAEVVGLSNVFARDPDAERLRAGCLARAVDAFPGLPVGGYALGGELAAAQALGFEAVAPLRVWVRSAARA